MPLSVDCAKKNLSLVIANPIHIKRLTYNMVSMSDLVTRCKQLLIMQTYCS